MLTDLTHAIQFLQTGVTILLGLALGEAFKQLVPDGDKDIRKDRIPSLLAFLFMIFPFFHGMSRYLYSQYLTHSGDQLGPVSGHVMFDGLAFLIMAAFFFVICRSLSPGHWQRFYGALLILLAVDSVWIIVSMVKYNAPLMPWLVLNGILAVALLIVLAAFLPFRAYASNNDAPKLPSWISAVVCAATTIASYIWMGDFYFP